MNNTNQHAHVRTRIDRTGKLRTETAGRDRGIDVAITTNQRNNSTRVFIDINGRKSYNFGSADIELGGREAWTLFRALAKHFDAQGKLG
jgi:hypothetical protein